MWRLVAAALLLLTSARAQTLLDLRLSQARHIVGTVLDEQGKPVAEASIGHSDDRRHEFTTDSEGRFELSTRAPALVVRKAGYGSELIRTEHESNVRITLRRPAQKRTLPACRYTDLLVGIEGWGARLRLPRVPGVEADVQGRDIDYGLRYHYVRTGQGTKGILHGSGPNWGFGVPADENIWTSVHYEEACFEVGGQRIVAARGQYRNGERWRYLGTFGESASYDDMEEKVSRVLDRVLDGACLDAPAVR